MTHSINLIFPIPFLHNTFPRPLNESELSVVKKHKTLLIENAGNARSISMDVLKGEPAFNEILSFIESNIKLYVDKVIQPAPDLEFYITQSWLNYTEHGGYHHHHNHPNSIISGVFYLSSDKSLDSIVFHRPDHKQIMIVPKQFNTITSSSWKVPVGTGDIVLFPSDLTHNVDRVVGRDTRISLAFNVFAKGQFGTDGSSSKLML